VAGQGGEVEGWEAVSHGKECQEESEGKWRLHARKEEGEKGGEAEVCLGRQAGTSQAHQEVRKAARPPVCSFLPNCHLPVGARREGCSEGEAGNACMLLVRQQSQRPT